MTVIYVSNPFKTGRYCVDMPTSDTVNLAPTVSNPFKTGRYCVGNPYSPERTKTTMFQTPSKRGGTA